MLERVVSFEPGNDGRLYGHEWFTQKRTNSNSVVQFGPFHIFLKDLLSERGYQLEISIRPKDKNRSLMSHKVYLVGWEYGIRQRYLIQKVRQSEIVAGEDFAKNSLPLDIDVYSRRVTTEMEDPYEILLRRHPKPAPNHPMIGNMTLMDYIKSELRQ